MPSMSTVQAPQWDELQPICGPVTPSSSRRAWISSVPRFGQKVNVLAVDVQLDLHLFHQFLPQARARALSRSLGRAQMHELMILPQARALALSTAALTITPATYFLKSTGPRVSATGSDAPTAALTAAATVSSTRELPTRMSTASSQ